MGVFFHGIHRQSVCRHSPDLLAVFWVAGLCVGAAAGYNIQGAVDSRTLIEVMSIRPSLPALIQVVFLPILISFLIADYHPFFLFSLALIKGICYGMTGVWLQFSSCASWLIRFLLMFSDTVMLPVFWMWCHFLRHSGRTRRLSCFLLVSALAFLIAGFDYAVVSPFCLRTIILEG